jgi:uncharacterized protein YjbI with pentapeptide repeats
MLQDPYGKKSAQLSQEELNKKLSAHERYLSHQGGMRAQLAHARLDGLNLANRNLEEIDLTGASLVGASLYGSNLHRVSLYCADLRDCDLRHAKLTRADLRGSSFRGAKLAYSNLDNADLRSGTMMYAGELSQIIDRSAGANQGVDFSNCSMKGVSFGNAKLDGVNFTGALLHGARFKAAALTNAVFKGAVLIGVNLEELKVPPEALAGAVQDVTPEALAKAEELKALLASHERWIAGGVGEGRPAIMDEADLRPFKTWAGRRLSGITMRRAVAIEMDFSGCQLQAAKLDGADLRGVNFTQADLRGASLRGAKLAHAIFKDTKRGSLKMSDGSLLAADLTDAEFAEEQLREAIRD